MNQSYPPQMSQRIFVNILFNHKNLINVICLCQNTDTSSYFLLSVVTPGITDHLRRVGQVSNYLINILKDTNQ